MMYGNFYQAPVQFHGMLESGAANIVGALVKEASSGKILAHVQETGLLQKALANVNLGSFSPLGVADLVASTYNTVQLDKLVGMTQTLTSISAAGLGIGLVGVGVSVASTAIVLKRLEAVRSQISSLSRKIEEGFADIEWREIERLLATAKSTLEHADVLKLHQTASAAEWVELAKDLGEVANQAQIIGQRQLHEAKFQIDVFEKIVLTQLLCRGAAIHALLQANAVSAAHQRAQSANEEYHRFFDPIDPQKLLKWQMNGLTDVDVRQTYLSANERTGGLLVNIRKQVNAADGQALLLESLSVRQINGPEYIHRLSTEEKEPFLLIGMAA